MPSHLVLFVDPLENRRLLSASVVFLPQATLSAAEDLASSGNYQFVVTYNASSSVNLSSLGNSNIQVTGPNDFVQDATLAGINPGSSSINPPVFGTYQITPASGSAFTSLDNGVYTVSLLPAQVTLNNGLDFSSGVLGTFNMDIPGASSNSADVPTVTNLTAANVTTQQTTEQIQITYSSASGIDASSISSTNLYVTGPNGFIENPTLVSVENLEVYDIATYQLAAPDGIFSTSSDGVYTINLNPNQVTDINGLAVRDGPLDTFDVTATGAIGPTPTPQSILLNDGVLTLFGTPQADTITVHQNGAMIDAVMDSQTAQFDSTMVSSEAIYGFAGADSIIVGMGVPPAIVRGGTGSDSIVAHNGTAGGTGNTLIGGRGDDFLKSGLGSDALYGGPGDDTLIGTAGDTLDGGKGNDNISVVADSSFLAGSDTLFGDDALGVQGDTRFDSVLDAS
ncbi:MAG TPA: hypothetical protein VMD30_02420 [Tepidisphaeraceae bacterium]|nr:hypothetical protein [Tepidisphaeraceae bacterium]